MEVGRKKQQEVAVTSALAIRQQFFIHGDDLEQVEVFKYLGRLLAQDDEDIQAIHNQLRKACAMGACVGQVLQAENVSPLLVKKFYGCGTGHAALRQASLEGFHIRAACQMVRRHKPRRGPGHGWIYLKSKDVLKECGMNTLEKYITVRWQTIAVCVATRPVLIECRHRASERVGQCHTTGGGIR